MSAQQLIDSKDLHEGLIDTDYQRLNQIGHQSGSGDLLTWIVIGWLGGRDL